MEKQIDPQLELFSQSNTAQGFRSKPHNELLERVWAYEKTILIIIAILVTGIIAFSMGVEKGKRVVQNLAPQPQVIISKVATVRQTAASAIQQQGNFTIQVASFKTKANAQKEAEIIKKRGLGTMLFSKGGYVILCVGSFPNREAAQPLLSELNKRYGSCQIRRL